MELASLHDWLVFLHVLAAMLWIGGLAALNMLGLSAARRGGPDGVARFVASLRVVGPVVLGPSSLVVLGVGIWLVLDSSVSSFGQTWIWLALTLLAAAVLVGVLYLARAAQAAERAIEAGDHAGARRQLSRWSGGVWLILLLLVVATWDMVFKPGL